jgi:RND family efflux transporter MFP subunit
LRLKRFQWMPLLATVGLCLGLTACSHAPAQAAGQGTAGPMAMPVRVQPVVLQPVAVSDSYVSTIKSRRSATIQPQVSGNLTQIFVRSGDRVRAGQHLMEIDPRQQQAIVAQQEATEQQKLAVYEYNQKEIVRQRSLYSAGIISKDAEQQAEQAFNNAKADYESTVAARKSAQQQLAYYHILAPFNGVVGDVPVHVGDYVSPTTVLTTVDDNTDLEAYIYIPAERSSQVHIGLPVEILDTEGKVLDRTKVYFVSPQVDSQLQGLLAKAKVHSSSGLRNDQQVRARVIWSTAPAPTVPVLGVTHLGGQTFVYVAVNEGGHFIARQRPVTLGDADGNVYAVQSGLQQGDQVIVSGLQFLVDGAPVQPMH